MEKKEKNSMETLGGKTEREDGTKEKGVERDPIMTPTKQQKKTKLSSS